MGCLISEALKYYTLSNISFTRNSCVHRQTERAMPIFAGTYFSDSDKQNAKLAVAKLHQLKTKVLAHSLYNKVLLYEASRRHQTFAIAFSIARISDMIL